jgi:hypothetical protein
MNFKIKYELVMVVVNHKGPSTRNVFVIVFKVKSLVKY